MKTLTLGDIFSIVKKWFVLLLVVPIAAAVVALYFARQAPVYYSASTSMMIMLMYDNDDGSVRYDISTSTSFAGDYKELINSPQVIRETCARLGIEELDASVGVSPQTGTRIIKIIATSTDPLHSIEVANTVSEVFMDYIQELMRVNSISIPVRAEYAYQSSTSSSSTLLMAALAALVVTAGAVFVIELLNPCVTSARELEELINKPVLARIEGYRKEMEIYEKTPREERKPLYYTVSNLTRENVKTLMSNIMFATMDNPIHSLLVTSCIPNEGKSTLCIMLATAMAADGKKVLIVDMDLRKPTICKLLGVRGKHGVVSYVSGTHGFDDVVTETGIPNVSFIDNRRTVPSPSAVPKMEGFARLMAEAKEHFDMVIYDSPPVGLYIDGAVLANMIEGTILITSKGYVECTLVQDVTSQLEKAGANLLGAVLNFENHRQSNYYRAKKYYYGKRYGYGHYGEITDVMPDANNLLEIHEESTPRKRRTKSSPSGTESEKT